MACFEADAKIVEHAQNPECLPEYTEERGKPVEHIIISGGGTMGLAYYGILQEAHKKQLWNINNIRTIYGTSVGSILATMLCLQYDWDTLDDYLIKRPWGKVFQYDIHTIFACIENNGIFDKKVTEHILKPLLLGKDIPLNVTMLEFCELTGIELHIMVTNVNTFESVDISSKTHPQWLLVDAVHASCSIPLIFKPVHTNNTLYCDGGFSVNYPIEQCIANGANPDTIFGIQNMSVNNEDNDMASFSLFDYVLYLMNKVLNKIVVNALCDIRHLFVVPFDTHSLTNITDVAEKQSLREELIDVGRKIFHRQYTE